MVAATLSLPRPQRPSHDRLTLFPDDGAASRHLPRVEWIERRGPLFHPGPGGEQADILSLHITHGYAFGSLQSESAGAGVVHVYADTVRRLRAELAGMPKRPRAVFVNPVSDPFPPVADIQAATAQAAEVLAREGMEVWLKTRGTLRPSVVELLRPYAGLIKITIGISTLDRTFRRAFEPWSAPARSRLRQIARLRSLGFDVRVAVDGLVPGLTDTRENLAPLLDALARVGVRHVGAGYLYLRQGAEKALEAILEEHGWDKDVLETFRKGPWLKTHRAAPARFLTKVRRQRGYAGLMALASERGMTVGLSSLANPDFRPEAKKVSRPSPSLFPQRLAERP